MHTRTHRAAVVSRRRASATATAHRIHQTEKRQKGGARLSSHRLHKWQWAPLAAPAPELARTHKWIANERFATAATELQRRRQKQAFKREHDRPRRKSNNQVTCIIHNNHMLMKIPFTNLNWNFILRTHKVQCIIKLNFIRKKLFYAIFHCMVSPCPAVAPAVPPCVPFISLGNIPQRNLRAIVLYMIIHPSNPFPYLRTHTHTLIN